MFDIGFAELLLILLVTLVVVGPQRLPETIRTTALWIGRIKRAASRAYQEVEKEVGMDDIRRQLHNEELLRSLREQVDREQPAAKPAPTPSPAAPESADHRDPADDAAPPGKDPNHAP
jgi:sec-independent protein translocase protein TatB